jgi:hypothetical protein
MYQDTFSDAPSLYKATLLVNVVVNRIGETKIETNLCFLIYSFICFYTCEATMEVVRRCMDVTVRWRRAW